MRLSQWRVLIWWGLFGERGDDEIAENEIWFLCRLLLFVKELLPIGPAKRIGEFGLGLADRNGEIGREVTLAGCDLLRVLVLGIVRDDFSAQTNTIIGFTGAVSTSADVVNGV